jgi:hypothetical protein
MAVREIGAENSLDVAHGEVDQMVEARALRLDELRSHPGKPWFLRTHHRDMIQSTSSASISRGWAGPPGDFRWLKRRQYSRKQRRRHSMTVRGFAMKRISRELKVRDRDRHLCPRFGSRGEVLDLERGPGGERPRARARAIAKRSGSSIVWAVHASMRRLVPRAIRYLNQTSCKCFRERGSDTG